MKTIEIVPVLVIVAALMVNLAIGIGNSVGFSTLMIRCIIVTIVFGLLSYMFARILRNALEYSRLSKQVSLKETAVEGAGAQEYKSAIDIKVPPLDDTELLLMGSDDDDDFIEVSPVHMDSFNRNGQI